MAAKVTAKQRKLNSISERQVDSLKNAGDKGWRIEFSSKSAFTLSKEKSVAKPFYSKVRKIKGEHKVRGEAFYYHPRADKKQLPQKGKSLRTVHRLFCLGFFPCQSWVVSSSLWRVRPLCLFLWNFQPNPNPDLNRTLRKEIYLVSHRMILKSLALTWSLVTDLLQCSILFVAKR